MADPRNVREVLGQDDNATAAQRNSADVSELFNLTLLAQANDVVAQTLMPVMVFLGVLGLVGLVGNALVCYVFSRRFSTGSQNFLVICLAVFDLHTCLLTIPYEIVDIRYYAFYIFDSDYICKAFKFVNTFCNVGSILTLVIIAVDRHRKVCRPFNKQLRLDTIRVLFFLVLIASACYATPTVFLYGYRTFNSTFVNGTTSRDCSTPNGMSTTYPTIFNGFLFLNFLVISMALGVCYNGILKEVRRRNKRRKTFSAGASIAANNASSVNTNDDELSSTVYDNTKNLSSVMVNGIQEDCTELCLDSKRSNIDEAALPDLLLQKNLLCDKQSTESCTDDACNCKLLKISNSSSHTATKNMYRSASDAAISDYLSSSETSNRAAPRSPVGVRRNRSDPLAGKRVNVKRTAPLIGISLVETTDIIVVGGASCAGQDKKRSPSSRKRHKTKNQTTMVAFSVTTMFIISFLPHLILMITKLIILKGFDERLEDYGLVLYNVFLRSYFINSMCRLSQSFIYFYFMNSFMFFKLRMQRKFCYVIIFKQYISY
ncbi:hypothetical protein Btru_041880 [Bulinus truncatus]|nr:hypothetical protein Btru_041880 [Bulinus truncatus]